MRNSLMSLFGILSAAALASCVTANAAVYSQGIYSAGTGYFDVCSTILSFYPHRYNLTEICWGEDGRGLTIFPIGRKSQFGDIQRRCLEVESGSNTFYLSLDAGPMRGFNSADDPACVKGSGDFAQVLMRQAMYHGGTAATNSVELTETNWICGSRTNEDIFILQGDHFVEIQNLLEVVYGQPDEGIHSSNGAGGNCCSINYSPKQIGVFLNLTRSLNDATIVAIIGESSQRRPEKS